MQKKLTEVYLDLEDETSKLGMKINEKKTKYIMYSFGCFPGVWLLYADVSEPSIGSIFKGWM